MDDPSPMRRFYIGAARPSQRGDSSPSAPRPSLGSRPCVHDRYSCAWPGVPRLLRGAAFHNAVATPAPLYPTVDSRPHLLAGVETVPEQVPHVRPSDSEISFSSAPAPHASRPRRPISALWWSWPHRRRPPPRVARGTARTAPSRRSRPG